MSDLDRWTPKAGIDRLFQVRPRGDAPVVGERAPDIEPELLEAGYWHAVAAGAELVVDTIETADAPPRRTVRPPVTEWAPDDIFEAA